MCLRKTHKLPKISEEKIEVYKLLLSTGNDLITPWRKEQVKDMKLEAAHSYIDTVDKPTIEGEGVHAYVDYDTAAHDWVHLVMCYRRVGMIPKIYLATIPPKTPYWEGRRGEIAATELLIEEAMPDPFYIK